MEASKAAFSSLTPTSTFTHNFRLILALFSPSFAFLVHGVFAQSVKEKKEEELRLPTAHFFVT